MKNSLFLQFLFALMCLSVFYPGTSGAQTINQKLITTIPESNSIVDAYSMKYDHATGGWVYGSYDTVTMRYSLITPKGVSRDFSFTMQYNSLFDSEGNVYSLANEYVADTLYKYFIVKNGDVIAEYDFINEGWVIKDDILYFAAGENSKQLLVSYDSKTGEFSKGKAYDEIRLCYTPVQYAEGEPMGFVGFSPGGKLYYVAVENDVAFLVIGTDEQKKYSDISWYDVKFDPAGDPCYIARSMGKFYGERGNTFLVQGKREYKTFDWMYGPIEFDKDNRPVFVGQDSTGEWKYRATLMIGNEVLKSVEGGIYNYVFAPNGSLAYIISIDETDKNGDVVYKNRLVYNGKESKTYNYISNLQFNREGKPVFVASGKDNKSFLVEGNKTISGKFDYISDYRYLPGNVLSYVGTFYGDYEKKKSDKYYVFIDEEQFGPFDIVVTSDWINNRLVLSDKKDKYAFVSGKNIDRDNYYYKYKVHTGSWSSDEFDNIAELQMINGKVFFFAGNQPDRDVYSYNYFLYAENKRLGNEYSAFTEVKTVNNVLSFIASKGSNMYYVEVNP